MSYKSHQLIKDHDVKWVDLRFTDTKGKQQHVTMPARDALDDEFFEAGKMFDGSSIAGWKGIEASDMILMPDDSTAVLDPFTEEPTLILVCDIIEPSTMQGYERDPRNIAKRAEEYLKSTGIGDTVFVGPEPEFFIFDEVKFKSDISGSMFKIFSEQASWNTDADIESGNKGHRPGVKGGYFPVPPVDHDHEIRTAMCNALEEMGLVVEVHHHEARFDGPVLQPVDRHLPVLGAVAHEAQGGFHFFSGVGEADDGICGQAAVGLQHAPEHVRAGAAAAEADAGRLLDLERVSHAGVTRRWHRQMPA